MKIGSQQNHGLKFQNSSEPSRDLILVSTPMFLGMGNHLGQFTEHRDRPEAQEKDVAAVGGPEPLQGVIF